MPTIPPNLTLVASHASACPIASIPLLPGLPPPPSARSLFPPHAAEKRSLTPPVPALTASTPTLLRPVPLDRPPAPTSPSLNSSTLLAHPSSFNGCVDSPRLHGLLSRLGIQPGDFRSASSVSSEAWRQASGSRQLRSQILSDPGCLRLRLHRASSPSLADPASDSQASSISPQPHNDTVRRIQRAMHLIEENQVARPNRLCSLAFTLQRQRFWRLFSRYIPPC